MPQFSDLRYAVKLLLKQRGFTAAALLTLALCVGANTAIFSVLNSVLLKPLPFQDADRLVSIHNNYPRAGAERAGAAVPDYYDRLELPALQEVAMLQERGMTIGEAGRPERLRGMAVTPSLFRMLGTPAAAGRTFLPEEGEPGNELQALLSWGLWRERYGGDPGVVGGTIRINEVEHTIVGVMPRGFVFQDPAVRVWVPLAFPAELRVDNARHSNNWTMVALLRPGATLTQAQQQIDALNARNDERLPQFADILQQVGFTTVVADYRGELTRDVRGTLWLLQAGVLLVLLIGCVNIANLVLVRSTARHRELATRAALGAPSVRLARQLVTESLVLAVAGGLLGVLLGWLAVRGFAAFAAERLPRGAEIALDGTTLLAALLASAVAGLLFSAAPILRLLGADLSGVFREEGRTGTAGRSTTAWRGALVTVQVALAFTLLVGAGLMTTSFARTLAVDPGFEPAGVLSASVSLPVTRYADAAARRQFADRLLEQARAMPGVTGAALTNTLPFSDETNSNALSPEGYEPRPDDPLVAPMGSRVSDGYFETMGIRVLMGRSFTAGDAEGAPPIAMVDRYLAERFWPGQDPVGRRIAEGVPGVDGQDLQYRTVVGVVDEVRARTLAGDQPLGHYYLPAAQVPAGRFHVVLRTAGPPGAAIGPLRAAVAGLDPDLPIFDVRTMDERLSESVFTERLRMLLLAAFGTLALLLAAVGLYGVLAYSVAQRSVEIGIRMALGSTAAAVSRLIVGQGARLIGIGLLAGLAASLALGRLVRGMLYGVEPTDPWVLLGVLLLLSATALAACLLPARRAMRVDPAIVIREGV
jgi:predicted permease